MPILVIFTAALKLTEAWVYVNTIWPVKELPISEVAYVKVLELTSTETPSAKSFPVLTIVRVAFCAQAVTFRATVADTNALPFSTTDVEAVLPDTLPSTVAFSLNAATTILPAEVVPLISLHDPCPVNLNLYPLTIVALIFEAVAELLVISKNLPFVK